MMITSKGIYNKDCKIFIDEVETGTIELIQYILDNEISKNVQVRIMPDPQYSDRIYNACNRNGQY